MKTHRLREAKLFSQGHTASGHQHLDLKLGRQHQSPSQSAVLVLLSLVATYLASFLWC